MLTGRPLHIVSIMILSLSFSPLIAQPDTMWTVVCGGENGEECYDLIQNEDGGFVMVGVTMTFGDWMDFYMAIIDSAGEVDTTHVYNHEGDNMCFSVDQTFDGGYILAGCTYYFGVDQPEDVLVVRTDADGGEVWSNSYELAAGENVRIFQSPDSSYLLGGEYWDRQNGASLRLIKLDQEGAVVWTQAYIDENQHSFVDMVRTFDGGYAIAGDDKYLLKVDADGELEWAQSYEMFEGQWMRALVQTSDSGYAFTTCDWNEDYYYLVITDAEGNLADSVRFEARGHTGYPLVIEHPQDGFIMSECTGFVMKRIDADLETVWRQVYSEGNCRTAVNTSDGGYAFAGCDEPYFGYESGDFYLIKTHPEPAGVREPAGTPLLSDYNLESVYPNPFNGQVKIDYNLGHSGFITLGIFDCTGRQITELYNGLNQGGNHSITWNAEGVPCGEYIIRLSDEEGVLDVERLLLIK